MDMNNFRPLSHVAQQSRREKLRIQQCSASVHRHLDDLTDQHSLEQPSFYNSSTLVSSELMNSSTNSSVLVAQREAMRHQELGAVQDQNNNIDRHIMTGGGDLFTILPQPAAASSHHFRASGEFQGSDMKSFSQTESEWMVNYAGGSSGRKTSQNAMLDGQFLSDNNSTSRKYLRPNNNYNEYQDTNPSSEMPCQYREKLFGDMHYATPIFQNTVQDVVTLASVGTQGLEIASLMQQNTRETGHVTWTDQSGNELVLLPSYGNQASAFRDSYPRTWTNRPAAQSCHQWITESGNAASDATTHGLSLSLSSNPPSKLSVGQFGEAYESQDLHSKLDLQIAKPSFPKQPIISKSCRKSVEDACGTSSYNASRNTGPLGPFTGYAMILKNSRFLKPAQELLDEFCSVKKSKHGKRGNLTERFSGERASASASAEANAVDVADREVGAKGNNNTSGLSSSTFYSSNQISCEGGVGSSSSESYMPEYQEMRAKLLYLQEEDRSIELMACLKIWKALQGSFGCEVLLSVNMAVSKRYKLYHQQLQMVVSSFESVSGLSAATPYVSLAFKSISKNFRCLKTAIMNPLKQVAKVLGEDMRSSTTGTSSSKGNTNMCNLDQILQKRKSGGDNVGFLEPQQHIWRPQRGLPECAVAILRAWLFEHFLHPYPTDTDKHMLATQTGLSRNQVSNWFINARVRVWKPMVEEIHMLETQGLVPTNQNLNAKSDGQSPSQGTAGSSFNGDQPMNKKLAISSKSDDQLVYSGIGSSRGNSEEGLNNTEFRNQQKRSRVESHHHQFTASMDRSLMGFTPYQRNMIDVRGLGAVSLTLGLRHGVESSQQQQQQQEDQLRRQFRGHMIHDFVG